MNKRRLVNGFIWALILLTCYLLTLPAFSDKNPDVQRVLLGGKTFNLQIADEKHKHQKGLSGVSELADDEGMMFLFDKPGRYCFWMKDTLVSLDILWFDEYYRLIHRAQGVKPETYPTSFCSPRPAKYVVELPAGTTEKLNLKIDTPLTPL